MPTFREPLRGTSVTDADLEAFGEAVWSALGLRPPVTDLVAALGAVSFREKQASSKLSPVYQAPRRADGSATGPRAVAPYCSATYASFASCPASCTFLTDSVTGERRGCFVAANGFMMRLMQRLDESAAGIGTLRGTLIGLAEAYAIDRAFPDGVPQDGPRGRGRILRIHVAGDAANTLVARALAAAVDRWYARGGGPAWCYTHRWRSIPRSAWGAISILASVETPEAAAAAAARGYAAAITLGEFVGPKAYYLHAGGPLVLPCAAEVGRVDANRRKMTCASCGWCFDDRNLLRKGAVIGFELHGHQQVAARRSVDEVRDAADIVKRRLRVV